MKIDVAGQFKPTSENIQEILTEYGLTLSQFELATSGIENCTLIIAVLAQKYVLRVYRHRRKPDSHIALELAFIRYLAAAGLKTVPALVNRSGQEITKYGSWRAILMPFQPGFHAEKYHPELVRQLATTHATMHMLANGYQRARFWNIPVRLLRENYFSKHIDSNTIIEPVVKDFLARSRAYKVLLNARLPVGYCHLDFYAGNVLLDDSGKISAILDFDDLAMAPYVMCLANSLWSIYIQEDLSLIKLYLDSYQTVRPLSNLELQSIPAIMLYRHYTIGSMKILEGTMNNEVAQRYLRVAQNLTQECYT
ncbi:phosphotransferase [bacterium]|nr:MAG: phosphotransferase [bacterium]